MRLIILFWFIPCFLSAQKVNDNWTTPIADIEFSDTKIIYTYSLDECSYMDRLHPVYYNSALLEMRGVIGTGCLADSYKDLLLQIYGYLDDWYIGRANNKDKYNFLKAATLLIIWNVKGKEFFPDNTIEILGYLENDISIEISKDAKLVLKLYDYYNEK